VVCSKEVQQIFDRYIKNNVRRLKHDEAVAMLKTEFNFTDEQANCMFSTFDKDKNDVMSMWEFQQFYTCVGNRCRFFLILLSLSAVTQCRIQPFLAAAPYFCSNEKYVFEYLLNLL